MSDKPRLAEKLYGPRPASETEEGRMRQAEYFAELGAFVDMYAKVESAVALTLWHYARTPHNVARAVFSGVRIRDAMAYIKRLAEVTDTDAAVRSELEDIAAQVGAITKARDDLLHYGALSIAEGRGTVTNALKALDESRITAFPISPKLLQDMIADLRRIFVLLHTKHLGRPSLRGSHPELDKIVQAPWRYKHQPQKPRRDRAESDR